MKKNRSNILLVLVSFVIAGCGTMNTGDGWKRYAADSTPLFSEEKVTQLLKGCTPSSTDPATCKTDSPGSFEDAYVKSRNAQDGAPEAKTMVRAGMAVGELLCDQFFTELKRSQNSNANVREQTNLGGGLTNTLLAIGKANASISNTIAAAFSFAGASMETYNSTMLFAPDVVKVRELVRKAQDEIRNEITEKAPPTNFHDGVRALNAFLYQCHLVGINELVQKAVARGDPGLEHGTTAREAFALTAASNDIVQLASNFGKVTLDTTDLSYLYWHFVVGTKGEREVAVVAAFLDDFFPNPYQADVTPAFKDAIKNDPVAVELNEVVDNVDWQASARPSLFKLSADKTLKANTPEIRATLRKLDATLKLADKVVAAKSEVVQAGEVFDAAFKAAASSASTVAQECGKDAPQPNSLKPAIAALAEALEKMKVVATKQMSLPPADSARYLLVANAVQRTKNPIGNDEVLKTWCTGNPLTLASQNASAPTVTPAFNLTQQKLATAFKLTPSKVTTAHDLTLPKLIKTPVVPAKETRSYIINMR